MTSSTIIEFQNVSKSYDGKSTVVDNLNLEIQRGEFLSLLGASGSGKTTTLMMLAGFERPTTGSILMNGVSVERKPPHKRGIGVVFQNYALFPHMSVRQNLAFPLRMRGLSANAIEEKVSEAITRVRLQGYEDRKPSALSGGQQQRVAVARALIFDPEVILMDEPLGALDKNLREHLQLEIKELHRSLGVTIIYVTHDQSEALAMSDRVAIFRDGRIDQIASPITLYTRPANPYVAKFIGENNLLQASVLKVGENEAIARLIGSIDMPIRQTCSIGDRLLVAVRPEFFVVGDRCTQCSVQLDGTLISTIYQGDHLKAIVRVEGQPDLSLKIDSSCTLPPIGTRITLGFDDRDATILKAADRVASAAPELNILP
jgi:putative spermidine/putrescine transport system ATP-binding protein